MTTQIKQLLEWKGGSAHDIRIEWSGDCGNCCSDLERDGASNQDRAGGS